MSNQKEQGVSPLFPLGIAALFMESAALILYLITGRTAFTPALSVSVILFACLAIVLLGGLLLSRFLKGKCIRGRYVALLLTVFAYLSAFLAWVLYIAQNVNYLASILVSIDGTKLSFEFLSVLLTAAAAWILALLLAVRFSKGLAGEETEVCES